MIIIPDIHGRTYWKDVIKHKLPGEKVIFLGDYVDPYPYEDEFKPDYKTFNNGKDAYDDISKRVLNNFREIIKYKNDNPNDVILLIGNHDCSYAIGPFICNCRYMRTSAEILKTLFQDNWDSFQLAYESVFNNKHFVFSHAGIHKLFIDTYYLNDSDIKVDENNIVNFINEQWYDSSRSALDPLGCISYYRGGLGRTGSIVWADINEWADIEQDSDNEYKNIIQVFGHTQLGETGDMINMDNRYYCLDSRAGFRLNEDTGEITVIK